MYRRRAYVLSLIEKKERDQRIVFQLIAHSNAPETSGLDAMRAILICFFVIPLIFLFGNKKNKNRLVQCKLFLLDAFVC